MDPVSNHQLNRVSIEMFIPDAAIFGIHESNRPILITRKEDGSFKCGQVLQPDEFVTSLEKFKEACRMAGLYIVDAAGRRL